MATLMQPLQYDLRCPAAKDNSIGTQLKLLKILTQALQCDLQRLSCKAQWSYVQRRQELEPQNRMDLGAKPEKSTILNAFKKEFLKRK